MSLLNQTLSLVLLLAVLVVSNATAMPQQTQTPTMTPSMTPSTTPSMVPSIHPSSHLPSAKPSETPVGGIPTFSPQDGPWYLMRHNDGNITLIKMSTPEPSTPFVHPWIHLKYLIGAFAGALTLALLLSAMYWNKIHERSAAPLPPKDDRNKSDLLVLVDTPELFYARQVLQGKNPADHPAVKKLKEMIDMETSDGTVLVESLESDFPVPIARKQRRRRTNQQVEEEEKTEETEESPSGSSPTAASEWLHQTEDDSFEAVDLGDGANNNRDSFACPDDSPV